MEKKKKITLMVLLVFMFVVFVAGITYAFFTATVANGDKGSSLRINTATMGLAYTEDAITCTNGMIPGDTCTHNFYVQNTGDAPADYYVYLWDIYNDFETKEDLVYSISCVSVNTSTGIASGTCGGETEKVAPSCNTLAHSEGNIGVGLTHKYTITFTFKETGVNQNENQGKKFGGKILVTKDIQDTSACDGNGGEVDTEPNYLRATASEWRDTHKFLNSPSVIRNQIESVNFTTTNVVPGGVIGSWDASAEGNGSIMAWYTDTNSNGLYEVTIGQDGGVRANPNSNSLFSNLIKMTSLDLTNLKTGNVTDMTSMFYLCGALTSLDLSPLNTSNVTNMNQMFLGNGFTNLDLNTINTSNVTNMNQMFNALTLTTLDLSPLNTSNVTSMSFMFGSLSNLTTLDLSPLNTSNVTSMSSMFSNCTSLTNLNLSSLNTSKVTNMGSMFSNCTSLTNLDLSSFDTSNVQNISGMFYECSLSSLNLSGFTFDSITNHDGFINDSSTPTTVTIYANSEGKTWLNTNYPTYSNITVV